MRIRNEGGESHVDPVVEAHPVDDMMGSITSWIFQHLCRSMFGMLDIHRIYILYTYIYIYYCYCYCYYYYYYHYYHYYYIYIIHVYNMYIICGDITRIWWSTVGMWQNGVLFFSATGPYESGFICRNGTAPRWYSGWLVLLDGDSPNNMAGWWFQALWKILVNGKDYPIYIYIMENKKCLKPPTRWSS